MEKCYETIEANGDNKSRRKQGKMRREKKNETGRREKMKNEISPSVKRENEFSPFWSGRGPISRFQLFPGRVSLILFEPIERLSGPRAAISNHLSPRNNLKRFVVGNLI